MPKENFLEVYFVLWQLKETIKGRELMNCGIGRDTWESRTSRSRKIYGAGTLLLHSYKDHSAP